MSASEHGGGMEKTFLLGRTIHPGFAEGEALVSRIGISFFGGVDPETGIVVEKGHDLEGVSVAGKVLVFPSGKGSTVGSYTLYRMRKSGTAPVAILNSECEPITAVGCILAVIPCIDHIPIDRICSGDRLIVNGAEGSVEWMPSRGTGSPFGK
jgi:predicted aconitase with swiveling domain